MAKTKIEMVYKLVPDDDEFLAALDPFISGDTLITQRLVKVASDSEAGIGGLLAVRASLAIFHDLWWLHVQDSIKKRIVMDEINVEIQGKVMLAITRSGGFYFERQHQPDGTYEIWLVHDPDRVGQADAPPLPSMVIGSDVPVSDNPCASSIEMHPEGLMVMDKDCSVCESREGCPVRYMKEQLKRGAVPFVSPGTDTEN